MYIANSIANTKKKTLKKNNSYIKRREKIKLYKMLNCNQRRQEKKGKNNISERINIIKNKATTQMVDINYISNLIKYEWSKLTK